MTVETAPPRQKLVLASASPRRLALLEQAGLEVDALLPADIDKTPQRFEPPRTLAIRLAREKALAARKIMATRPELASSYLLAADTVVAVGRRIMPKCETIEEADECLQRLSGRTTSRIYGGDADHPARRRAQPRGRVAVAVQAVERRRNQRLSRGGRMARQGWRLRGAGARRGVRRQSDRLVTAVVGLPLYETINVLAGEGFLVLAPWLARG